MSQSRSRCSVDLTDQDPVPPDDYSYILSIAANKYEVLVPNMREGTLSRIIAALDARHARPALVMLGSQAQHTIVLDVSATRVCIEMRPASDIDECRAAVRLVLGDDEVEALRGAMRWAADFYDE